MQRALQSAALFTVLSFGAAGGALAADGLQVTSRLAVGADGRIRPYPVHEARGGDKLRPPARLRDASPPLHIPPEVEAFLRPPAEGPPPPGTQGEDGAFFLEEDFYAGPSFAGIETEFDGLAGVRHSDKLPHFPDAELAALLQLQGGVRFIRRTLEQSLADEKAYPPPSTPLLWVQLSSTWQAEGNTHRSLQALRKAISLDPALREAAVDLALVLRNAGRLADAKVVVERALAQDDGSKPVTTALARFVRGSILLLQGRGDRGAADMEAAEAVQPLLAKAHAQLSRLIERRRQRSVAHSAPPGSDRRAAEGAAATTADAGDGAISAARLAQAAAAVGLLCAAVYALRRMRRARHSPGPASLLRRGRRLPP